MTFFYDLNKKLDDIRATHELTHGQLNEGIYQGGPDKSQIPAVNRPGSKLTTADLEKERTQSPTSAEGMRALQDRLSKIHPIDETMDEAAKYRDAKYKDKLYTQEPPGDDDDYSDDDYYNPKPADYPGAKRKIGGGEFDHNDPLRRGDGIGRSGIKNNINLSGKRKGMPSRDQITSLKGSIKSARGTHAEPNLPEAGDSMTPKQKSFAKLAPPADKITFADKIAGAKKEVDEMLGDVAAEAMKNALSPKQQKLDKNHNGKLDATDFEMLRKGANTEKVDEVEGKVYRHKGTYGQSYDPSDDEETKANVKKKKDAAGPAKRGRPEQNTKFDFSAFKKPVVAKSTGSGRVHKLSDKEPGEKVKEGEVSTGNLQQMHQLVSGLKMYIQDEEGRAMLKELAGLIKHYVSQGSEQELDEKAVSKKQQKFMGMVHAAQTGEKPASKEVGKVAKSMKKSDAEDFAATKHKGLPEKKKPEGKKKEESVEENTVAGSVAPAEGGAAKGKGGMTFGKGVYEGAIAESFRSKLDTVLNEGMSVNMSADQDGKKSLTVTATDDDAVKLSQLLNLAGIGGQSDSYGAVCPDCGSADCGCDHIDEELANSADNTVYNGDALQYSGGLNGPKTDQSTLPVINQDPRRTIGSVAEGVESRLWELYQRYERK